MCDLPGLLRKEAARVTPVVRRADGPFRRWLRCGRAGPNVSARRNGTTSWPGRRRSGPVSRSDAQQTRKPADPQAQPYGPKPFINQHFCGFAGLRASSAFAYPEQPAIRPGKEPPVELRFPCNFFQLYKPVNLVKENRIEGVRGSGLTGGLRVLASSLGSGVGAAGRVGKHRVICPSGEKPSCARSRPGLCSGGSPVGLLPPPRPRRRWPGAFPCRRPPGLLDGPPGLRAALQASLPLGTRPTLRSLGRRPAPVTFHRCKGATP